MKMYKLMESDEMGYFNTHTQWLTWEEAVSMLEEHVKYFPNSDWIIEDDYSEPQQEVRYYNENACDGWEDIYPL